MTFWWLILISVWGGSPSIDHIEFSDEASCRATIIALEKDWNQQQLYKYCVPAGEKR